jgi:hypothetical protein
MFIAILTLLSALSISGVAAYYSIIGLATIFPGAFIPVVLMGSVLEVGKLVCASWLYRNWRQTNILLKSYLFFAVIVLSIVTSMGIFGFLSKAHLQNEFADGSVTQKIEIINSQIKTEEGIIARQNEIIKRASGSGTTNTIRIEQLNQRLLQLDREVEAYTSQGTGFLKGDLIKKGIELKKSQQAERDKINAEIDRLANTSSTSTAAAESQIAKSQQKIVGLIQQRDPLMSERLKLEAEIGPIKYIAALAVDFGWSEKVNANSAVRWVIIILIFVFDPLAVLMLVAANQSLIRRFPVKIDPPEEILDLEKPDLDTPVIPTGVVKDEPKEDPAVAAWNQMIERANEEAARERALHKQQLEDQAKEWQAKLDLFNSKVEKPEPKKIEIVPIDADKKPEDVVSYTIKELLTNEIKEEPKVEEIKDEVVKVEYKIEEEPKKKTDERLKPDLTEVIETESSLERQPKGKPLVLKTIKPETKTQLPKDDFERRGMLNKLHQEHGKYKDVSDVELKQERDDFNRQRFLDAVAITEDDARNHPPITKGRMAFFEDYLDDILRGDTEAENLPPEIARTCAVLLSDYDNPAIVEPQPAGIPDRTIETVTTEGLKEKFAPEPKVEDRDITEDELDKLLDGFNEEAEEFPDGYDIVIQGGKKIKVAKKNYIQNEEQAISDGWSRIKELDLPEPEKNEIILPMPDVIPESDVVELADNINVEPQLPKAGINKHRKRLLSDDQYREKIEQRINDLITKIESGEIRLSDLSAEDQTVIIGLMKEQE